MLIINNFIKENYLILIILVINSLFTIHIVWEYYPIFKDLDEAYLVNSGLRVLNNFYNNKSLDPEFYTWGSFPLYVSAILNSLLIFTKFFFFNVDNLSLEAFSYSIQRIDFHIINRLFSFLLMNVSIFIIYFFCKKNFNFFIAILASLILLISPEYLYLSTMATIDHWNVFFSVLIIYYSFEIYKNFQSTKNIVIYGIIIGISVATKYFNIFFVIPFLTICIEKIMNKEFPYKQIIILSIMILFSFIITMPYSIINFHDFSNSVIGISKRYTGEGEFIYENDLNNSYLILIKNFLSMSFINFFISAFSLISIVFLILKKKYYILITYPIIFCLFIGSFKLFSSANIISIIPYIAILSSIIIYDLYIFINKKINKNYFFVILFLLFLPSLNINYIKIKNSFLEDTRYTSLKWIEQNINPEDQILAGHYSPPVWFLKNFKDKGKFWFQGELGKDKKYIKIGSDVKYVVFSSGFYGKYFNSDGSLKTKLKHEGILFLNFFENNELIKEFRPDYKKTTGLTIRIYLNNLYKD